MTKASLSIAAVGLVALLMIALGAAPTSAKAPPAAAQKASDACADPLARSYGARACFRRGSGYTVMDGSTIARTKGDEVIVFDGFLIISSDAGTKHVVIPRDHLIYTADDDIRQ